MIGEREIRRIAVFVLSCVVCLAGARPAIAGGSRNGRDHRGAAAVAKPALKAAADFSQGLKLARAGEFAAAEGQFAEASRLAPSYDAFYNLGLAASQAGDWAQARAAYIHALDQDGAAFEPNLRLGLDYLSQHQPQVALAWLEKARRQRPRDPVVLRPLGAALLQAGFSDTAATVLARLTQLQPNDAHAWSLLGQAEAARDQNQQAVADYRKAIALDGHEADFVYNLGVEQERLDQRAAAVASYRAALKLNPRYAPALAALGRWREERGQWQQAMTALRQSLATDPHQADTAFELAKVEIELKHWAGAQAILQGLIAASPKDPRFHYQLARALHGSGHSKAAAGEMAVFQKLDAAARARTQWEAPRSYIP